MKSRRLAVILPVFEDWPSVNILVSQLDKELETLDYWDAVVMVLVDDGSNPAIIPAAKSLRRGRCKIAILKLGINSGHQRAIAEGLSYAYREDCSHFLIMDGDGEDSPEGALKLLERAKSHSESIVVARRGSREEGLFFQFLYRLHRVLFRLLVGEKIDFGNFMVIPRIALEKIYFVGDPSAHLAATILKTGLPLVREKIDRARRLDGISKMNGENLVRHSFAALAVFSERIIVRLLIGSFFAMLVAIAGVAVVVVVRFLSEDVVPGWATIATGLIALAGIQFVVFAGLGALITLNVSSLKGALLNRLEPLQVEIDTSGSGRSAK